MALINSKTISEFFIAGGELYVKLIGGKTIAAGGKGTTTVTGLVDFRADNRSVSAEVDLTATTTLDGSLGTRLYDDNFAGSVTITAIENLTRPTVLDVSGGGTVSFSTAIKDNVANEFYGDRILVENPYILLTPKQGGGIIVTYINGVGEQQKIGFALSDSSTALAVGTDKAYWIPDTDIVIEGIIITAGTAPTGATIIVDMNVAGTSILSTKASIDIGERTSATSAVSPVLASTQVIANQIITFDIDQVGSTVAGAGLIAFILYRNS